MRHQKNRHKLSRSAAHRKALLRNLCKEVIQHERIKTSEAKAKAVKPELEKLITLPVARGDLLEQLVDRELVLPERAQRLAPGVQVPALGQRDELLDLGLDRLGLRLGGLDPLVLDCLLYTSPSPRDLSTSRMPSSA